MNQVTSTRQLTLAGTRLERYFHICSFFNSREEEYETLSPFFKEGLEAGEKALHIVDPQGMDEHADSLARHGIDCVACRERGQLDILGWDQAYLKDGAFDQERMLTTVDGVFAAGRLAGFDNMRIMGKMDWAFEDPPGAEQLISYEARVNEVLERNRQPAICVYDVSRLTGALMMDILRCHPLTLIDGIVHENSFYTPPELLLEELRERESRRR